MTHFALRVPSGAGLATRLGEKTAVVVGAGPAGLVAALTLRAEGFADVLVVERRETFSRGNVVNLHPESLHVLARLGVLEPFLERASLLSDHRNNVHADGAELYGFQDRGQPVAINPECRFDAADVAAGFRNETLYSIALAELQDLLALVAFERGVQFVAPAVARVVPEASGVHSVRIESEGGAVEIASPALIVVADGAKGAIAAELGAVDEPAGGLWPDELWIFGNCRCRPPYGFSNLLFEFHGRACDDLTISNGIFLPNKGEMNIAVTVRRPDLSAAEVEALIAAQCAKVLAVAGVAVEFGGDAAQPRVVWHTGRAVRVRPRSARRVHFGHNVVLAGDAAGANSPVAAFGGTLSTSAYSYAVRHLVRDLERHGATQALATYDRRVRACVSRWHQRVAEVRRAIEADVRPKALRLLAGPPSQRDLPLGGP
jgi:2-polyprenyl-6-methoxyphenol hydroxylase-like FAD-dependent oxidoreductase